MFLFLKLQSNYDSTINKQIQTEISLSKVNLRQIRYIQFYSYSVVLFIMEHQESAPSFKVILIGDSNVGKTSLIRKYIHGSFKDEYEVTVGVDFSSKTVIIDNQPVQLQIWDTCGQDVYKAITTNFYRGAAGVFLVYSVNNRHSFESLSQWLSDFQEKGSKDAFIFLIGTKCDLEAQVQAQQAFEFMKTTSAKSNMKVDELFSKAAETMFKYYQVSRQFRNLVKPERTTYLPQQYLPQRLTLEDLQENQKEKKRKCCS